MFVIDQPGLDRGNDESAEQSKCVSLAVPAGGAKMRTKVISYLESPSHVDIQMVVEVSQRGRNTHRNLERSEK